jgi:hypothetical protein
MRFAALQKMALIWPIKLGGRGHTPIDRQREGVERETGFEPATFSLGS